MRTIPQTLVGGRAMLWVVSAAIAVAAFVQADDVDTIDVVINREHKYGVLVYGEDRSVFRFSSYEDDMRKWARGFDEWDESRARLERYLGNKYKLLHIKDPEKDKRFDYDDWPQIYDSFVAEADWVKQLQKDGIYLVQITGILPEGSLEGFKDIPFDNAEQIKTWVEGLPLYSQIQSTKDEQPSIGPSDKLKRDRGSNDRSQSRTVGSAQETEPTANKDQTEENGWSSMTYILLALLALIGSIVLFIVIQWLHSKFRARVKHKDFPQHERRVIGDPSQDDIGEQPGVCRKEAKREMNQPVKQAEWEKPSPSVEEYDHGSVPPTGEPRLSSEDSLLQSIQHRLNEFKKEVLDAIKDEITYTLMGLIEQQAKVAMDRIRSLGSLLYGDPPEWLYKDKNVKVTESLEAIDHAVIDMRKFVLDIQGMHESFPAKLQSRIEKMTDLDGEAQEVRKFRAAAALASDVIHIAWEYGKNIQGDLLTINQGYQQIFADFFASGPFQEFQEYLDSYMANRKALDRDEFQAKIPELRQIVAFQKLSQDRIQKAVSTLVKISEHFAGMLDERLTDLDEPEFTRKSADLVELLDSGKFERAMSKAMGDELCTSEEDERTRRQRLETFLSRELDSGDISEAIQISYGLSWLLKGRLKLLKDSTEEGRVAELVKSDILCQAIAQPLLTIASTQSHLFHTIYPSMRYDPESMIAEGTGQVFSEEDFRALADKIPSGVLEVLFLGHSDLRDGDVVTAKSSRSRIKLAEYLTERPKSS